MKLSILKYMSIVSYSKFNRPKSFTGYVSSLYFSAGMRYIGIMKALNQISTNFSGHV